MNTSVEFAKIITVQTQSLAPLLVEHFNVDESIKCIE